ncbi:MAG: (d)CMP kinase [Candidatus Brocadiales bacterium]|nr:(d)CMP kinase [Candidatus Bathyanammoxibius amoris]
MIITMDGPAGSGKSTVARALAKRLNYRYIDTGAFYRAFTWKAIKAGADLRDEKRLCELVKKTDIRIEDGREGLRVLVDGEDVTREIRSPEVTGEVHFIASLAKVREPLVGLQRAAAAGVDAVAEGRDTGTVVFPDADRKFYLDARPEERARRRYVELGPDNTGLSYEGILEDIKQRDRRDSTREASPLRSGPDFISLDTTGLSVEEVVERLLKKI